MYALLCPMLRRNLRAQPTTAKGLGRAKTPKQGP